MRTTNNMLGDCYASAVVEELSKKELTALNAASHGPSVETGRQHITSNGPTDFNGPKDDRVEGAIDGSVV